MKDTLNPIQALHSLNSDIAETAGYFYEWAMGDEYKEPSWSIEKCFFKLLVITEALGLEEFRKVIYSEYDRLKKSKHGFNESDQSPDGDPYSVGLSIARRFVRTLESFYPEEGHTTVTKDLLQIIRDIHYVITDKVLFHTTPSNENDIHLRIEGILKCVFPDLKHKPTLTKQIKNFQPDTGIPSLETLIEYKFLSSKKEIAAIADQVLADTRGYTSKDWRRFLYVIYETHRFKTENDWSQLLKQSGVSENTTIIVLSGEPIKNKKKKKELKHS
jgi:hypothetical protein